MALELKLYQQRTLDSLERFLGRARIDAVAAAFEAAVDKGLLPTYRPLRGMDQVPYVCLRVPTGGGKTLMGAHIIRAAGRSYLDRELPLVLWLVPTTLIKVQTMEAFRDPRHPYRQELDDAFGGHVAIFDVSEIEQIRPADLAAKVCIVVATMATARVADTELRNIYAHKEALEPHFAGPVRDLPGLARNEDSSLTYSFANLLAMHGPLVVTDEAHNATTDLSYEVYRRLYPRLIVEMTATPDEASSNVLVSVSALELKAEHMIKLPVILKEHNENWETAVAAAVARRRELAQVAVDEPDYIRPILLVQAENVKGVATVEEVRRHLLETEKMPAEAIAVATGDQHELDGVDLFARDCKIEVVITKQALKEGWDCSFAYVFCSVAQVHSDKDVQQLLGRVLRMPYAKRRHQAAMNKAYAHVVTKSFGTAAAELTLALQKVGFNPFEAKAAIQKESAHPQLPLTGGAPASAPPMPTVEVQVVEQPDLAGVPERDVPRITYVPYGDGRAGGMLMIADEIDPATVEAIIKVVPPAQREGASAAIELQQQATFVAKAPSEQGAVFRVPRLCTSTQGDLDLIEAGQVADGFAWNLLDFPADLTAFAYDENAMTFLVDIEEKGVTYTAAKENPTVLLPGFARERTLIDLLGWLDQNLRSPEISQPVMREWIRRAMESLTGRGFSLAQLLQGQFILRRKLEEQLRKALERAASAGFQATLFGPDASVTASLEPASGFEYPADMMAYPARRFYEGGYRFQKHYYPVPGDLSYRDSAGREREEFLCAKALDSLDEVAFWVRNLVHHSQFWFPTSRMRHYPDFVAHLSDGRLFVVEYKGGDRVSNDDSKEKRAIGELWAAHSGGRAIYLMAQKSDEKGRGVRDQLLATITG